MTDHADRRSRALGARRLGWAVTAAAIACVMLPFYRHPIGAAPGAATAVVFLLAAVRPYEALLVLAALGPLSTILFAIAGIEAGGLRLFELMTLATLGGWAAGHAIRPAALAVPSRLVLAAGVLMGASLVSCAITASIMLVEEAGSIRAGLASGTLYFDYPVTWNALSTAMLFPEGLLLMLATADVVALPRRREGVLRMMVIGAAAAGLFNVLRLVTVALSRADPWTAFQTYLVSLRINVHHGDWNAAGSYFAMTLFLAAGLAARERLTGVSCTLLIGAALWLTGSRTALAAAFLGAAALGLVAIRNRGHKRTAVALAIAGIAATGLVLLAVYPNARNADASLAFEIRMALAKAALTMTADYPWFGIGLGRFFELSRPYTNLPTYIVNENAHNNFLQVLAELGVTGLVLFVAVLGLALGGITRPRDVRGPREVFAAPLVFLVTCLGGHPLLLPHVAYPFWMALGLAAAYTQAPPAPRWMRAIATSLVLALVVTLPFRGAAAVRGANLEGTSAGFSKWQREPDGSRYRWAGGRSTFHVPASARWVRVPLQHGSMGPEVFEVRILLNGREADRVVLRRNEGWRSVRLIPVASNEAAFIRIDLEVWTEGASEPLDALPSDTGGVLKVGRPFVNE